MADEILQKIDQIKESGFRPCVIAVLVCNGKLGLFHSHKYPGYEFLQGGINFGETPIETVEREALEEAGYWFYKGCNFPPKNVEFLFEEHMKTKVKETLLTENGKQVNPEGKHYLVYLVELNTVQVPEITAEDMDYLGSSVKFDKVVWADSILANKLTSGIQNLIKRDIAKKAIDLAMQRLK